MSIPKISIITVSRDSIKTISATINSVLSQTYPDIEYIIIDGLSTDGTDDLVKSYGTRIATFISEPDAGIYDAINKGIKLASGDIIGILNSDDFFYDNNVVERIADAFTRHDIEAVYGDVQFVKNDCTSDIIRYYSSKSFTPGKFKYGIMPAHPGFYVKRELFEKLGYYKTDYKIAADYELLIRFLYVNKVKSRYLEMPPLVTMRSGGVSNRNVWSNVILNREIMRACRENGIRTNYILIYSKYFRKIFEFFGNKRTPSDGRME